MVETISHQNSYSGESVRLPESPLRVVDAKLPGHKERTPSSSLVFRIKLLFFLLTNGWGTVGGFSRSFVKVNHAHWLLCDLVAVMKD